MANGVRDADDGALVEGLALGSLAAQYGYRDGPPLWPGAPTAADAATERSWLIKRCRRFALDILGADEFADKLELCSPRQRCGSGGCPEKLRATQRVVVANLEHCCQTSETKQLVTVSMISPGWRAPTNGLNSLQIARIRQELTAIFDRSRNFRWAALGIDISLNDETQRDLGVSWQAQCYGIASVLDRQRFATALRENFVPPSRTVKRPVRVAPCDGTPRALSYVFKTNFVKRVAYWGFGLTRSGQPRRRWRTRKVSLRAREEIELRLWLDRIGIGNRLLFLTDRIAIKTEALRQPVPEARASIAELSERAILKILKWRPSRLNNQERANLVVS